MNNKEKLTALSRIEAWAKGAQKDVEHMTKVFENTFQENLEECSIFDSIFYVGDEFSQLESSLDSLTDYINDAKKELTIQ